MLFKARFSFHSLPARAGAGLGSPGGCLARLLGSAVAQMGEERRAE